MNINLELYKIFYYVAKNENISRAANELLISQPAISKSIKTLEEQTNTNLFIRKRDGVELTETGEMLYKKIKDSMELIYSAENDLKTLTNMEVGTLSIGTSKIILHEILMPYIKEFHENYPKIKIQVTTGKTQDLIRKTRMGLIDTLITTLPNKIPPKFKTYKLTDLHDCFAVNNLNEYKETKINNKSLETIPLLLLSKGSTTRKRLDDYCIQNNIKLHPKMEFTGELIVKDFTLNGFGIGLFTEEYIKNELEEKKLFKLESNIKLKNKYLGLVWDSDNKSQVAKNFINFIKEKTKNR